MTEHAYPDAAPNTADLFEIIRTTRSMRRLKPDPVPKELIRKILEAGVCAPSGGNMQRWRFLVIRDARIKETVGAYYKRAWDEQVAPRYRSGAPAPGMSRERFLRLLDAAEYLAAHIHEAPVRIVPCLAKAASRPTHPARPFTQRFRTCCWRRERSVWARLSRRCICSSRRKWRPRSDCRPAFTPMPCCRSATQWDGSGQYAVSRSPTYFMKTSGVRLIATFKLLAGSAFSALPATEGQQL
jgi:nitroreductase